MTDKDNTPPTPKKQSGLNMKGQSPSSGEKQIFSQAKQETASAPNPTAPEARNVEQKMADRPKQERSAQPKKQQQSAKSRPKASGKKPPKKSKDVNLNDAQDWEELHKSTTGISKQMNKLEAYGDKLLETDEDLPLRYHVILMAGILSISSCLIWANFAKLDEITRGQGKVIPSSAVQVIQHQEGGTVQALLVQEGDEVEAGQVLMRLSNIGAQSELGSTRARLLGLKAKGQRLQAEAQGLDVPKFSDDVIEGAADAVREEANSFRANKLQTDSQKSVLQSQLRQRQQEVREINTKIADVRRLIALTNEEASLIRPLVMRGSAPKQDLLKLDQTLAQQQSELNAARVSLPRARSAINEAQARLDDISTTFKTEAQSQLTDVKVEASSLMQQMPALRDRKKRTDIRSPVNGLVKDIRITTGEGSGVIRPGDAIMEIVPIDDQLVIEARIKPSDIAFLHPGQEAMVKITAYDFAIYGGLKGKLTGISADTITDEKGESFYEIKVTTDKNTIERNGKELNIIPGMVASIDVLTGEKTVMEFIMKPIFKTWDQSLNER